MQASWTRGGGRAGRRPGRGVAATECPERALAQLLRRLEARVRELQGSCVVRRLARHWAARAEPLSVEEEEEEEDALRPRCIVCYGLGTLGSRVPEYQFALLLLLVRQLRPRSVHLYDPLFTALDRRVFAHFELGVLSENEMGRRRITEPTLFYMPHCETFLYENVLACNLRAPRGRARRPVPQPFWILGNSFRHYARSPTKALTPFPMLQQMLPGRGPASRDGDVESLVPAMACVQLVHRLPGGEEGESPSEAEEGKDVEEEKDVEEDTAPAQQHVMVEHFPLDCGCGEEGDLLSPRGGNTDVFYATSLHSFLVVGEGDGLRGEVEE